MELNVGRFNVAHVFHWIIFIAGGDEATVHGTQCGAFQCCTCIRLPHVGRLGIRVQYDQHSTLKRPEMSSMREND